MLKQHLRNTANRLQTSPLRGVVATAVSVYASVRNHQVHVCFTDRQGDWVNWQRSGTIVSPTIHMRDMHSIEASVHDLWNYRYCPRAGDIVVDVGAGIGEETVIYSRLVGASGRVVAIEAHPHTFACLGKTIASSRLTNVTALNLAVTAFPQDVFITDDPERHMANAISERATDVRVHGRTLDSVLAEAGVERVDLLKMNIEGAEKPALAGMNETIAKTRFATISCHDFIADKGGPERMRTRSDVQAFLEKHGFDIVRRRTDARAWVRDYLYAVSRGLTPTLCGGR